MLYLSLIQLAIYLLLHPLMLLPPALLLNQPLALLAPLLLPLLPMMFINFLLILVFRLAPVVNGLLTLKLCHLKQ